MQGFDGQLLEMTKDLKNQIHTAIENMANQALRTIIIAQKQLKSEGSLINFPN
jgi:magnesium-transporting ATPase (P-type)